MSVQLPLIFPDFNLYSTPLLVLVLQGLIFSGLLFYRYIDKRRIADLLLSLILLITCYHRTTYTIGFMDWYDTFQNTKINYYLVSLILLLAPLIYFYVKSVTEVGFTFKRKDWRHFIPVGVYIGIKVFILIYDAAQPGFSETQNGYLVENFEWKYLEPFNLVLSSVQMILYLAFSFQLLYVYKIKIRHFFSNTYKLELNWLRNFLLLYAFLFVYSVFEIIVDSAIVDLNWRQTWWYHLISALVIIYVGVKGYFTDTFRLLEVSVVKGLHGLSKEEHLARNTTEISISTEMREQKEMIANYFKLDHPYLNPDLTLVQLANDLNMSRSELSEVINKGYQLNFNDFVNQFRIENVKKMIDEGKHEQLSLLGIAFDSGFNSKATFNRVFKKFTATSPSDYVKSRSLKR